MEKSNWICNLDMRSLLGKRTDGTEREQETEKWEGEGRGERGERS